MTTNPYLIAAYIRVSTDEQAEQGISIPAQKSRLAAYCQAQSWEIYDYYIDDGYSGKDLERPGMRRLIDDVQAGHVNAALVLKLDRLSRRQKDVLYLLEDVFEPNSCGFKSVTESFDTTTPFGKAALGMMAVFAQLERETIVERVRLAKKESARQGRFMGGPPAYGYQYNTVKKCLEINEVQAETVRCIYDRYLAGAKGYQSIGYELESREIPGPTNDRWSKQTVRKILTNPVYVGLVAHKGELHPGKHEAIVSQDKWQEVQALIHDRGSIRSMAGAGNSLLASLIWCGECGARMRTKNVWQNYPRLEPKNVIRYYVCYSQDGATRHMIKDPDCRCGYKNADEIEGKVIQQLYGYSFDPGQIYQVVNDVLANDDDRKNILRSINQARKEHAGIEKKLERWYTAFEKGALDPDELMDRVKDLRNKKKHLEEQVGEWEARLQEESDRQVNATEVVSVLQNFPAIWEEATVEERRVIVTDLVKSVAVYKDGQVKVEFKL